MTEPDLTLEQRIARGRRIAAFLEDADVKAALNALSSAAIEVFRNARSNEDRIAAQATLLSAEALCSHLQSYVDDGEIAADAVRQSDQHATRK